MAYLIFAATLLTVVAGALPEDGRAFRVVLWLLLTTVLVMLGLAIMEVMGA